MARYALKKKKPLKTQYKPKKLKSTLWQLCRELADKMYPPFCFTCGAKVEKANKQLGHFIPSSTCGAFLRYDMRNLRWQCMKCNVWGGGQGAIFYKKLVELHGQEYVDQLFRDKEKVVKADIIFYLNKIDEYKAKMLDM